MKVQNPGRMFEIAERNFNVHRQHGVDYNVWCNAAPLILADLSIFFFDFQNEIYIWENSYKYFDLCIWNLSGTYYELVKKAEEGNNAGRDAGVEFIQIKIIQIEEKSYLGSIRGKIMVYFDHVAEIKMDCR